MENSPNHTHVEEGDVGMIQDFIQHVRGIIPLLEHVKDSIEDSSSRIPKASMQLSEVTTATESATVEILNVLEAMTTRIGETENQMAVVRAFVERNAAGDADGQAAKAVAVMDQMLAETKDNSMNIAIALQVQDITSQQIAGVSHVIESIRVQLAKALKRFEDPGNEAQEAADGQAPAAAPEASPTHFDGDAQFSRTTDRQDIADEIVKQWNQNKVA